MDSTPRHVWVEKGGDSKRMESLVRRDVLTHKKTTKGESHVYKP